MGVASLLPTQTATSRLGVKPMVQLSLRELVVPVLTATWWLGITKRERGPKAGVRAALSERISAT